MIKLIVPKLEEQEKIIAVMLRLLQDGMRAREAATLLEEGQVSLGRFFKKKAEKEMDLFGGEQITIGGLKREEDYLARSMKAPVYEDESFAIWNKPAGLRTISNARDGLATVYSIATEYMQKMHEYDADTLRVPYICYRLEKEIGGLVIVAKSQWPFENMLLALKERRVKRFAKVIVTGEPQEEAALQGYLLLQKKTPARIVKEPMRGARPCALRYKTLERKEALALLEVELLTAYPGQMVLQLAAAGLPVLGDTANGSKKNNRAYHVYKEAVWADRILFETGRSNSLEYLNGKSVQAETVYLPKIGL
ncbi:MAG: pseudouridine synthase [Christensenellaceae bacterium]|jgi:23S rRNA pseudouridine1911/1915/1917 synthase